MNITFCNLRRGVGKSLIAHQLIQGYGYNGVEIDPFGTLNKKLPEKVEKVRAGSKLLHSSYSNTIFDFGGFEDPKLYQAIEMSAVVVVPFLPTEEALDTTRRTVENIIEYNRPILLIANMVHDPEDIKGLQVFFSDVIGYTPDIYHLPFNMSLQNSFNDNLSIMDRISSVKTAEMYNLHAAKSIMDLHALILQIADRSAESIQIHTA